MKKFTKPFILMLTAMLVSILVFGQNTHSLPSEAGKNHSNLKFTSSSSLDASTIELKGVANKNGPLFESFEGDVFPPEFWMRTGGLWQLGLGSNAYDGVQYCKFKGTDTLITPELLINEGDTFKFAAKNSDNFGGSLIFLASTDKVNWETIASYNELTSTYAEFEIDLSSLATEDGTYIGITGENRVYFDFVRGPELYFIDNDLAALDISGSTTPSIGEENIYSVTIRNLGLLEQTDYMVKLYTTDGTEVASAVGETISSMEFQTYDFSYTFDNEGENGLYAETVLASDENNNNNQTGILNVDVQPEGFNTVIIGEPDEQSLAMPLSVYYKTSLTQSIYFSEEIGMGGILKSMTYYSTYETDNLEVPIRIWLGETQETNLEDAFLPASEFTHMLDTTVIFLSGDHEMTINFGNGYNYQGNNLVVMIEKPLMAEYYSPENGFYGSSYTPYVNRTRFYNDDYTPVTGENPTGGGESDFVPQTRFVFDTNSLGYLEGTVTSGGAPIEDALVSIDGTNYSAQTNSTGYYEINYIPEGNIDVTVSAFGYESITLPAVITENDTTTLNIEMIPVSTVAVNGLVVKADAPTVGIENAEIVVTGYENYEVFTDVNGEFYIENVWTDKTYNIEITAEGCTPYQSEFTVLQENLDLGTIVIDEIPYPAYNVKAERLDTEEAILTWDEPNTCVNKEFRYDDGGVVAHIGIGSSNVNAILGAAHFHSAIIEEVSYFIFDTYDNGSPKIFIFGLDVYGKPDTDQLLYESELLPNINEEWVTYVLPEPVDAPNGFLLGISRPGGYIGLGVDDGAGAPYEFNTGTHFGITDYTDPYSEWIDAEDMAFPANFTLRASGVDRGEIYFDKNAGRNAPLSNIQFEVTAITPYNTGSPKYSTENSDYAKSFESYNVYRFEYGDEENPENWVSLASEITDTSFVDVAFPGLDFGIYRFAVEANYSNDVVSDVTLSNPLTMGMEAELTINITTNAGDVEGAQVLLINHDGDEQHIYEAVAPEGGVLVFDAVWKGIYDITVSLVGYTSYEAFDLEISDDIMTLPVLLEEITIAPENLELVVNNDTALFSWNNSGDAVFEDFESYDDWSLSFAPWTLLDIDESATYGFSTYFFPYTEFPMAYTIFNPSATEPAMEEEGIQPYSGNKFAACFNAATAQTDDWMISEEYIVGSEDVIRFMAKSYTDAYGLERFTVGVSTTGTNPDAFEIISGAGYIEAPSEEWTEFSFDLSAYAGQTVLVGIHCVSDDSFVFMVDDVYIGPAGKNSKAFVEYNIYLDDMTMPVASTTEINYEFLELEYETSYTAGVSAVYTSGETEIKTIDFETGVDPFTGIFNTLDSYFNLYPNPTKDKLFIESDYSIDKVDIYNTLSNLVIANKECTNGIIDVSNLTEGIYIIRITSGDHIITKKISISH